MLSRPLAGLLRATLARADRIIVSNERLLEGSPILAPHLAKCAVVPFGVDTAYWGQLDDNERSEVDRLALAHPRLVLAVGRLVAYKGFDVLVDAVAEVRDRGLDVDVVIAGEPGESCAALRAQLAETGRLGPRTWRAAWDTPP